MAILTTFITSIVEMLILAGVSYGGIRLGKVLRDRKDAKCRQKYSLKNRFRSHRRICCESIWSKRT